MKKKPPPTKTPKVRKSYSLDNKATARKYYLIGLTLLEVGKLTDTPVRTVEKWYISENWKAQKETANIKTKANDLFISGKSYKEISDILGISKPTVYRYIKTVRNENRTN